MFAMVIAGRVSPTRSSQYEVARACCRQTTDATSYPCHSYKKGQPKLVRRPQTSALCVFVAYVAYRRTYGDAVLSLGVNIRNADRLLRVATFSAEANLRIHSFNLSVYHSNSIFIYLSIYD